MKEWIKFEKDEDEGKQVVSIRASRFTTMALIARLLLDLAKEPKDKQSMEILLEDLKVVYIPITMKAMKAMKAASEKTERKEVIDPE